jgi:hypothetical protein
MSYTIGDLIGRLEELQDQFGEDAEVRIASQQNWPFEHDVKGLVSSGDLDDPASDGEGVERDCVWLVEGNQLGYFTKDAWDVCS